MSIVYDVSADSFDKDVLLAKEPVVALFFSPSCPHCQKFNPVFAQLVDTLKGKAKFVRINVIQNEANRALAHTRGVHTVPTTEVFYRGRVIGNIVGYHDFDKTESTISQYLNKKEENVGPGTHLADLTIN